MKFCRWFAARRAWPPEMAATTSAMERETRPAPQYSAWEADALQTRVPCRLSRPARWYPPPCPRSARSATSANEAACCRRSPASEVVLYSPGACCNGGEYLHANGLQLSEASRSMMSATSFGRVSVGTWPTPGSSSSLQFGIAAANARAPSALLPGNTSCSPWITTVGITS